MLIEWPEAVIFELSQKLSKGLVSISPTLYEKAVRKMLMNLIEGLFLNSASVMANAGVPVAFVVAGSMSW